MTREGVGDFRRVLQNAGWNLLGNLMPLLVAVAAVPLLISRIGPERFGLLSLAWVLIGYFSLFDLGLGRAMTKMVAELDAGHREDDFASVCSTGLVLVSALGLLGGLLIAALIPWSGAWTERLSTALQDEAKGALILIALGIPLVVVTAGLRGILEGRQRFKLLSVIRIPAGIALFLAPCISSWFSPRLDWAVAAMLLTRLFVAMAHLLPCLKMAHLTPAAASWRWVRPMLQFGGWLTVSNVVGPVIVYVDRFMVGALLSASAVAHYAAPFEVVSRLLLFPLSLTTALFPALANLRSQDHLRSLSLRRKSLLLTFAVTAPIAVVGAVVAKPVLQLWLGDTFATNSSLVMQILLLGFVFNALAQIPFSALQSYGRTRATAMLHLVQLPVYSALLAVLIREYGLPGAAAAWALRALVDFLAMTLLLRFVDHEYQTRAARHETPPETDARLHRQA